MRLNERYTEFNKMLTGEVSDVHVLDEWGQRGEFCSKMTNTKFREHVMIF